ncbi:membrane protein [Stutzerimonas stutzeri]|uniref:Membrane protein n=1 Tax=Stutzerimonas stutzeri TaxID=316 RepID=W8QU28_STUST|nr:MMPL family transporter [Stutzerimonas stutzeri]AHL74045.1 membrane protein [Stutzerimonas stutzeri]MCQ4328432.1 MMPL family transporter [Stutzerimonas stutzeri]
MISPTDKALRLPAWLSSLFFVALLGLVVLTAWQWRDGPPVSANLLKLLPSGTPGELEQLAEQRVQEPLNRDLMLLIHHEDEAAAFALADELADNLRASGLFAQVRRSVQADLPAVRQQLLDQRLVLLDRASREALIASPEDFVQQRLQRLYSPFESTSLVPVEQDWFGFADLAQRQLPQPGHIHPRLDGLLVADHDGQRWAVIHAQTHGDAFDDQLPLLVADQIRAARHRVEAEQGELLAAGGMLHAAYGQRQAREEASLIGSISLVATLALLHLLFRTPRVLLVALPVVVGALSGAAACIALFGQIHVLTLVLGASLVGVSIDFPLHYLSKSWTLQPWHAYRALRLTLPGLALALATNVIGYLAMGFTPFPALSQVAVFSAAGLLGAFACATCLLPSLLSAPLQPWPAPLGWAQRVLTLRSALLRRVRSIWLLIGFVLFCIAGISQLSFKDDLRQWVARTPALQQQAERIGEITGFEPTSQYFLVRAATPDELLERQDELAARLDDLVAEQKLHGYLALSQLITPAAAQESLHLALPRLLEASQPLLKLGVTADRLEGELADLLAQPVIGVEDVLAGPLAEPWRPLWLGTRSDGSVAGLVSLQGLRDSSALHGLAEGIGGVSLVDRPAELNRLFAETQRQAALLKLCAAVLIFALLCLPFGWRGALRCLAVPLLAALGSLACLGWLGQPLTLFGLFGLLLVTAIGVDYAILMRERIGGAAVSLVGTLLAAVTTWLSFGLLALSSTPAVSNFGLAVGLGLVFAFVLAPWAAEPDAEAKC